MPNPYIKMRSNADLKYLLDEMPKVSEHFKHEMRAFYLYPKFIREHDPSTMWMYVQCWNLSPHFAFSLSTITDLDELIMPTNSPRHFVETVKRLIR